MLKKQRTELRKDARNKKKNQFGGSDLRRFADESESLQHAHEDFRVERDMRSGELDR